MSRSINIGKLLSVYTTIMNDNNMRINFISYVAENHPRILLKFAGADETVSKKNNECERLESEIVALKNTLNAERSQREYEQRNMHLLKRELEAFKNPVSNSVSDAVKAEFESKASFQDREFGANPNAEICVGFRLKDHDKKINTIKWCRENTGYGLAEAKGWVEGDVKYDYSCSYSHALVLRESFRKFAMMYGYTGVILINNH